MWVKWAQTLRRYPELEGLEPGDARAREGTRALPRADHRPAAQAGDHDHDSFHRHDWLERHAEPGATAGSATAASSSSPAKPAHGSLRVVPSSKHSYYCLAIANLVRSPAKSPPAGLDYCAVTPGLLLSRDTGLSHYATVLAGGPAALAIRRRYTAATQSPHSVSGARGHRRLAARGARRRTCSLRGSAARPRRLGVRLIYNAGKTSIAFASGSPQLIDAAPAAGAQSTTIELHNGWTVQSFAVRPPRERARRR